MEQSNKTDIDPITLQIAWNMLRSIADESFLALMRASFSTNIKERHDHSTAVLDREGRLIAQADLSLPIHLASMTGLARKVLERFDDIAEGDLFIGNDPHESGGTHLPDINLVQPVVAEGRLIAFIVNIAHHADVGGAAPGSMSGGLNEIWQEGLRIPPVRLRRKGVLSDDLLRLVLLNMRLPDERRGDLEAQIAACHLGARRFDELAQIHGAAGLEQIFAEILRRSEGRTRSAIRALPDGDYGFEDVLDDDGLAARNLPIKLRIEKEGDQVRFDFAGSAPQAPGNVNLTLNAVESAVFFALKALLDPELPNNSGVFAPIEINAPEGSLLNCRAPAATALRANTSQRVIDVVLGALADALPERAIGAANGANTSAVFSGVDPRSGAPYVYLETLGGGMGARATKDGKDGVQVHITNTSNLPVEAIEMEYPLRVEEYALRDASGGAGRFRGGRGLRRVVRPVDHDAGFSGAGERFSNPPWGVFGGGAGATGGFFIRDSDGALRRLPHKFLKEPLPDGSAAVIETPGAGGYGAERPLQGED